MSNQRFFVVCIEAAEDEDLRVGHVYRAEPDGAGARSGLVRVWDESGEDYLYPATAFIRVDVTGPDSERLEEALTVR